RDGAGRGRAVLRGCHGGAGGRGGRGWWGTPVSVPGRGHRWWVDRVRPGSWPRDERVDPCVLVGGRGVCAYGRAASARRSTDRGAGRGGHGRHRRDVGRGGKDRPFA